MICAVYKSLKKPDTYLFVMPGQQLERAPQALLAMLGKLEYVMTVDLDKRDKLAQSDPQQVKTALLEQGYYLQLPPTVYAEGSA
ncbi:MAG: YcgL domain-containing protein [Gammaproteobacteria bacterium]|nr:YcgL domain-containing protein [Gammaproteobacteria bacterium]